MGLSETKRTKRGLERDWGGHRSRRVVDSYVPGVKANSKIEITSIWSERLFELLANNMEAVHDVTRETSHDKSVVFSRFRNA